MLHHGIADTALLYRSALHKDYTLPCARWTHVHESHKTLTTWEAGRSCKLAKVCLYHTACSSNTGP